MRRRGRRCKLHLNDLGEKIRYWNLKATELDRTLWITRFGRGCGPIVRLNVNPEYLHISLPVNRR